MSSHLPTAAVIGAGSSGITALKGLVEQGIEATCFEASDRVGGNWVFENKNGMSACYRDLHINTSRAADGLLGLRDAGGLSGLSAPRPARRVFR